MADLDPRARVTVEQVSDIISTSLVETQVNAFINSAHRIVEDRLAGKSLTEATLTEIELWLSAHFISMREQQAKSVKIDDTQITYHGEVGPGLKASMYGQQALALDPTGSLASSGSKRAVIKVE